MVEWYCWFCVLRCHHTVNYAEHAFHYDADPPEHEKNSTCKSQKTQDEDGDEQGVFLIFEGTEEDYRPQENQG